MSQAPPLVEHGIQTERSDYRAHVCYIDKRVYLFRTKAGLHACTNGEYALLQARQPGVDGVTAEGYGVPYRDIPGLRRVRIPEEWYQDFPCSRTDGTSIKGECAVGIISRMLRKGMLPIELGSREVGEQSLQIEGVDIIVNAHIRIQVKMDYCGGEDGGYGGNLWIQIRECNPLRRI